ncbi:MAG: hypothetical protein KatS3mg122_2065 [Caldimonas sp.]|uniref:TetR family transcriptional regulator n=1 Tax=Caldimonas taiwanensis TaxID=307483 RepID=UPI0018DCAC4E|nr:TetR family transcriptional regulator [Caldimonas taiwanensis]GIX24834.1 MAG: hypothetical protein KatS3mg122_2065 [Caldimonas sp.]
MARRTKEEAEQTRRAILAAARRCFHAQGVSMTSLEDIAKEAGVTRGAVYWHFANKGELIDAMFDEVSIPFIDRLDYTLLLDPKADARNRLRNFLRQLIGSIDDPELRVVMEILEFKCEFVGERSEDLSDWIAHSQDLIGKLERTYEQARLEGTLRPDITPRLAALETKCFLGGLLRLRLLRLPELEPLDSAHALIDAYLQGVLPLELRTQTQAPAKRSTSARSRPLRRAKSSS